MHVLHAIHDFLPRHRAGSEIYALELARAQSARHHVTILCADYDLSRTHGEVIWRVHEGLPVVEIVNNWRCDAFDDTYRPPVITDRIRQLLRTLLPDVVHVHNLLNLSFDLPADAHALGIPVVATLHDYTLVCPSGGQRVHVNDQHFCAEIDVVRCARCFSESPFHLQSTLGRVAATGALGSVVGRAATAAGGLLPPAVTRSAGAALRAGGIRVTPDDLRTRLQAARAVLPHVDLFVAPSRDLANFFEEFGVPADRMRVSDYGVRPLPVWPRQPPALPLRVGFVGTLMWSKGVHVLLDALRALPHGTCRATIHGNLETFPEYVARLRERAAGLDVEFAGAFDRHRTTEVYAGLDLLVVPSIWPENSPLVIREAAQAGLPVVASRTGGIPELVTDGDNGLLFRPGSAGELASCLERLARDLSLLARLGSNARPVKPIDHDAREWETAYAGLKSGAEMAVS